MIKRRIAFILVGAVIAVYLASKPWAPMQDSNWRSGIPPGDEILMRDGDAIHQYCWDHNVDFDTSDPNSHDSAYYKRKGDAEKARIRKCEDTNREDQERLHGTWRSTQEDAIARAWRETEDQRR